MSVEFRQKTAGEYLEILLRRKWLLILPLIAILPAVGYVVSKLPGIYQSTTLLTLKPPTIPEKVVQSLSEEDLSQRLQTIQNEVLSRSSLEPMVAKYNLFEQERQAGTDMAMIVDKMRNNIKVEPDKSENEKVASFRILYSDRSPEAAQMVAGDLAEKFVDKQVSASTQNAETTREFLDKRLEEAKSNLDAFEKQRMQIMTQNVETLPESSQGLIAQLEGLRKREETISKEKETLITEKGRLNDSIRALNSQMRLIEDFGGKETETIVKQATRVEDSPAYISLIEKRADLEAQLENLKLQYKEKHPKVIETRNQIAKLNDELKKLTENTAQRVQDVTRAGALKTDLQKKNLEIERQKAESQITQIDAQMQGKDQELAQNNVLIGNLETKINTIPNVKVALDAIDNQYKTSKTTYDELLKKRNDAGMQLDRDSNAQGETIRVVDAANRPETPVNASKRYMAIAAGAAVGLAIGLFLTILTEFPRLLKIQNLEDAKHYTGLPVLASVPPLLTHGEIASRRRLHWLKIFGGLIVALASIPLLIVVLQATRVFEKLVS